MQKKGGRSRQRFCPLFENLSRITTLSNIEVCQSIPVLVLPLSRITTLSNSHYLVFIAIWVLPLSRITTLSNIPSSAATRAPVLTLSRITTLSNIEESGMIWKDVLPLSRITTLSNLKLHFHAAVLCKCIRLHQAAQFLTVYHYSKIWHKSLSIMKRSSASIVSWQGPSMRTKLKFSSLAFS